MSVLIFGNNAGTTLASPIGSSDTTCTLVSATDFPVPSAGQYFVMSFFDAATGQITEIVWVTALVGSVATIVRAQEGTTALSWNAGDKAQNCWTAGQAATMAQVGQIQAQTTNSANDSGIVNAYVATLSPAPGARIPGMPVRILNILNTNTGASTLDVGLGASPIYAPDGSALIGGELVAGADAELLDHSTYYQLSPVLATPTRTGTAFGPSVFADSGTANAVAITDPGNVPNLAAITGRSFTIKKVASANTGAVTVSVNTHSAALSLAGGGALVEGDLPSGATFTVVCNGTTFVLQSGSGTAATKAASDPTQSTVAAVSGATTAGHFLVAADTVGTVEDGGAKGTAAAKAASNNSDSTVASVTGGITAGHIAVFADTEGSIEDGGPSIVNGKYFTGYQTGWSAGETLGPFSHGLGTGILMLQVFLQCTAAGGNLGYPEGRVVPYLQNADNNAGITVSCDATHVWVTIAANGIQLLNTSTFANGTITPGDWGIGVSMLGG